MSNGIVPPGKWYNNCDLPLQADAVGRIHAIIIFIEEVRIARQVE